MISTFRNGIRILILKIYFVIIKCTNRDLFLRIIFEFYLIIIALLLSDLEPLIIIYLYSETTMAIPHVDDFVRSVVKKTLETNFTIYLSVHFLKRSVVPSYQNISSLSLMPLSFNNYFLKLTQSCL